MVQKLVTLRWFNKQLVPCLGGVTVSHLRFEHVDAAVSGMIGYELASKTIRNAVMLLRTMLAGRKGPADFRRGLAFADPTLGVKLPPVEWEWYLGPPKSRKSLRAISATEGVMRLLADLKIGNTDSAFVFAGKCHGFIDPDVFEADIWRPITDRAGLKGTRFHDLRHFYASQLIANGETAAYVQDQMGHSSIHLTFDTYGRLFPGRGKEVSERYEKSMDIARRKSEGNVSNPLAMDVDHSRKPQANN